MGVGGADSCTNKKKPKGLIFIWRKGQEGFTTFRISLRSITNLAIAGSCYESMSTLK